MSRGSATEEDPDEAFVVATARAAAGESPGTLGIGDDAAVVSDGTVVTTDTMVEGIHWDSRLSAADVGWKLVAVNVSDLGAMGARPAWATLNLALPSPLDRAWVQDFYEGLGEALLRWSLPLVGGDTTRSPGPRVLSLTVAGRAARPALRSTARPDDDIWVSGVLGRAAEAMGSDPPRTAALAWLRRPEPPVALGIALAEAGLVTSMIDLSDGLARDLGRICRASGVGALVDPVALPTDRPLPDAVAYGEDYELCFTARPADAARICSVATMHGVKVTRIGRITASPTLALTDGRPWPGPGFDHFSERSR